MHTLWYRTTTLDRTIVDAEHITVDASAFVLWVRLARGLNPRPMGLPGTPRGTDRVWVYLEYMARIRCTSMCSRGMGCRNRARGETEVCRGAGQIEKVI